MNRPRLESVTFLMPKQVKIYIRIWESTILHQFFYFGGWFSYQMGLASIPDRYVDAFQGRLPQTILARHYSDYAPEKLIQIYKQANLKILN